jgi:hypothetical protein
MRRLAVLLLLLAAVPASAKLPVWDRRIDSAKRFKVLKAFDSEAVLDQETGVVWALRGSGTTAWEAAFASCANEDIGGRGGWRLPTVYEMRSIARTIGGRLPDGHPFELAANLYWTSTTVPSNTANAFIGDLDESPETTFFNHDKTDAVGVWCVRGGIGTDDDAL